LTASARPTLPTRSPGAPTATSKNPSPLKFPLATAAPKLSSSSAAPPTPPLPWVKTSALGSSPVADP
jgi:hypothetical protein